MTTPRREISLADFDRDRLRVLHSAPIDPPELGTAAEYLATRSLNTFASAALAGRPNRPLIQPRGGFIQFKDQRTLTLALDEAGADFIPLTIDSHSRHNDYAVAAVLLERSEIEDKNLANGYPLVNHGHRVSRRLYDGIDKPVSLRHGTPDARLLAETAMATGITEIEGGALSYTLPYSRSYPIAQALVHWQYVDRLAAELSTPRRRIHRESFGVLTATMVPPVMTVVAELCELLLAVEQGVTSFSLSFSETGSLIQDLALARVLRNSATEYLSQFGFTDIHVYVVYHQWMGAFPYDVEPANALIANAAQKAAIIGADKIVTKTKEEARGIPSLESNAEAVRLVHYVLRHTQALADLDAASVSEEAIRIQAETDAVMTAIFDLPHQAFWNSVAVAFETGIIDVPFSPHEQNANKLVTRRGKGDGVYISEPGNLPIPPELLAAEHAALNGVQTSPDQGLFKSLVHDINLMSV